MLLAEIQGELGKIFLKTATNAAFTQEAKIYNEQQVFL